MNLFKNLFGFEVVRKEEPSETIQTFVQPSVVDEVGNAQIIGVNGYMGNHYSNASATSIEITENNHIQQCREIAMYHEIDSAIEEIVSEAIITDENEDSIKLDLSQTTFSEAVRVKVRNSFKKVYNILDFKTKGYNIFRKWYIDGRLYYHIVIDEKSPKSGIKELRNIDPKKIRRIRQFVPDASNKNSFSGKVVEHYVYNNTGIDDQLQSAEQGTRISKDSIAYSHSGLTDANNKYIVSFLNKAIAPTNKLRTLENSMVIHRLCLVGNSRIKTTNGYSYIKDINIGDEVYSYDNNGNLALTKVNHTINNGIKPTYSVKSKHHNIIGTETHPILVHSKFTNIIEYVDIKDINPDVHSFVFAKLDSDDITKIDSGRENSVIIEGFDYWVKLKIKNKELILKEKSKELNIKLSTIRNFLYASQYVPESTANYILDSIGYTGERNYTKKLSGFCKNSVNFPEYVDEEFSKLFGFLIGDGSIGKYDIVFAEGVHPELNEYYSNLMKKYFGNCVRGNTPRTYSNWKSSNTLGAEIMHKMGYIDGCKNKRIPEWVFNSDDKIKMAFVVGLVDADGCIKVNKTTELWSAEIELANERLIDDVKELWTSMGYSSGHIRHRIKPAGRIIKGNNYPLPESKSWTIYISLKPLEKFEKINTVEYFADVEVFDIGVEHEEHNFVANGVVVHNTRAPERRIFYIDVGNLPKGRAEQYLQGIAQKYKTKVTYDSVTGKIRDDRSIMSMTEDYFIPRRDGNKSTEVVPLAGATQAGGVDELEHFKKEVLKTLNVPYSRLDSGSTFNIGNSGEMSKEEANFAKFISRLRTQFNMIFDDLLGKELVLTQVMSIEEWESEKKNIHYDYLKDNYFAELLQSDMLATRLGTLAQAEPYVGKYFSMEFVKKHILMQTDEEMENEAKQIEKEYEDDPDHHVPVDSLHQTNLHQQMTDIDMDKEIAVNAAVDPNPFKEEVVIDDSAAKLNESMTELFKSMTHTNLKMIDIDDITV